MSDAIDEYERELADHMAAAEQKAEQCERATTAVPESTACAPAARLALCELPTEASGAA